MLITKEQPGMSIIMLSSYAAPQISTGVKGRQRRCLLRSYCQVANAFYTGQRAVICQFRHHISGSQ